MKAARFARMAAPSTLLDGVFGINKPMGMSSAQVIRDCQHHFNPSTFFKPMIDQERAARSQESNTRRKRRGFGKNDIRVKMGHGGTLDPLATGVLILGVGKGTKSLQSFLDCTKTYETVVIFGASTDTYDRVGKILKKTAYDHITQPMVEEALNSFRGKFQQMPPLYSALKMEGKPLYEYAREGKPIPREIATREVEVTELELVEWYEPGQHSHRWPAEEATTFERNFAEQVWKIEKQQMTSKKLSPEEEEQETKALNEHESFKRKSDENVDALVYDRVNKRRKTSQHAPLMSGALGDLPPATPKPGRGSNLIPETSDTDTPPPWEDKGPPAARIRMTVTSGFYVRSFCHDLGVKIGSAAMMAELCRSRQGDFVLGSSNCLEYSDLAKGESVWAPQLKDMLSQWNNKPRGKSSEPALRAKPVLPVAKNDKRDRSASPVRFEEPNNTSTSNDILASKKPTLPTLKSSSPTRDVKSEEVEGTRSQETNGDDSSADIAQAVVSTGLPASQAAAKSDIKSKDADEESWNGFPDTPAAVKA
ncbi:trub family pseudouridylate synthase-containing protein [Daldinia vernicosa]|uniref:trub family pseudouridylate synthase-containing protein n=1 Tax=Daldinia vernicosa TaxID=114800 RepID=UPI002007F4C5|nr:trub family pseudouridylate synthase-containing protein [Daldinia vernicosa]KAI0852392.1 trub family pseudouridylate synthase-containing protein [Daldinia vernicosa]